MEVLVLKRKGKKQTRLENIIKEKYFDNRYRLNEKVENYQSLRDPHSSYYFNSSPVRKQLFFLKKAVKVEERNPKEKDKLTKMIQYRLLKTEEDELMVKTKTYLSEIKPKDFCKLARDSIFSLSTLYSKRKTKNIFSVKKDTGNREKRLSFFNDRAQYSSEEILNQYQNKYRIKTEYFDNPELPLQPMIPLVVQKKQTKQNLKAQKLREELHEKKRDKWLNFLEQKKKNIKVRSLTVQDS